MQTDSARAMVKALKRSLRIPRKPSKIMAWPGNVRELMNVIERAVIVSDGPVLQVAEKIDVLPIGPVREEASESIETRATKGLAEAERKHILRTLEETGWRIEGQKGAAQFLGMNPSTMRARMRKLGIKRPGTH